MTTELPLPVLIPNVPEISSWIKYLEVPYSNRQFTNGGSLARQAEEKISQNFLPNTSTIVCCSNTSGLIASLLGLGLANQKVLVSNYTFTATLNAVHASGAIPIISDVNSDTWEISDLEIRDAVARIPDIAGVVITRVHGFRRDYGKIQKACRDLNLKLIIDAAAAFPHTSVKEGIDFSICDTVEIFSFHATKPLGIGEGGAISGNESAISKIRKATNFGLSDDYLKLGLGINAKMDEFAAARLLSALDAFSAYAKKRVEFVAELMQIVSKAQFLMLPKEVGKTAWPFFPVVFDSEKRLKKFQKSVEGIFQTRRYYFPALNQGFSASKPLTLSGDVSVSQKLSNTSLCLPVLPDLSQDLKDIYFQTLFTSLNEVD